ncbi:MAG: thermonuclease family protein [Alphaproteobacteria bacterium]|nr:thermonuclease family protein [Alphaproteobacteria bacterium]
MRQIILFFAIIASFLSLSFPALSSGTESLPRGDFSALVQTGSGRVLQIISPQDLQLDDGRIIRLSGVHFPDYSVENTGPYGLLAMQIMNDMLLNQEVDLYQTPDKDRGRTNRMGHHIAHVVRKADGVWVQGSLIALGLGMVRTSASTPEMVDQMAAQEEHARLEKLGIWESAVRILPVEDTQAHIGSFQIVEGRIESVTLNKNRLFLNFGKNWRDDFTITISPENRKLFSKNGENPLSWNGRILRARGWIDSYNGPNMEIDHPEALVFPEEPAPAARAEKPPGKAAPPARDRPDALPPALPIKPPKAVNP